MTSGPLPFYGSVHLRNINMLFMPYSRITLHIFFTMNAIFVVCYDEWVESMF